LVVFFWSSGWSGPSRTAAITQTARTTHLVRRPAANLEIERSKVRQGYSEARTGAASLRLR